MKVNIKLTWVVGIVLIATTSCVKEENYPTKNLKNSSNRYRTEDVPTASVDTVKKNNFTLKIVGIPEGKSAPIKPGKAIYLKAEDDPIIWIKGGNFGVLDPDGVDGLAVVQIPAKNKVTKYAVYAVPIGSYESSSNADLCAYNLLKGKIVCGQAQYLTIENDMPLMDIAQQLLFVHADVNHDGVAAKYPLFHSNLENYFWKYDKNGLKVLSVQFSEVLSKQ